MRSLKKKYIVGPGETDCFNFCRPSAFLNFMQDVATEHAGIIGLSRDTLVHEYGAIWILARCWYRISRPIVAFEELTIETWHRGLKGAMWYRDFHIAINGEHIGDASNAWVLADVETHRARRPTGMEDIDARSANPERALPNSMGKLACKTELTPSCVKQIRYSDLDVNGHLNNAKYGDLVCDAIALDTLDSAYIRELQINYTGECKSGDKITLASDDFKTFVTGQGADGRERFIARVTL